MALRLIGEYNELNVINNKTAPLIAPLNYFVYFY